jgi:NodT family efflux transporter outer membrane factor (OMF) lipoprotein
MRGAFWNITARRRRCALFFAAAILMLAMGISGCTPWGEYKANGFKVGPNYHRPSAAVADHWIDATDKRLSSDEPDLSQWWTAFNDPQLNELIQAAVHQNLSLKEACFRILEERAALAIAVGNLFPQTQQAVGSYTRNAVSVLQANQGFLAGGFPGTSRFFNNWDLGFNLAWELDFWGRFRRAIESAEDNLNASVFDYDDVLVTLLGDVGSTYIQIRTLQQQIEYVKENIKIQNEALEIAQARFQGGLASDLDTQQAISQLAQTEALIPQFEKQLRAANDRLCVLLGIPTDDLMPKLGDKDIPQVSPDVVVGVPCDLLMRRPDVRRAEQLAASQSEQIGIAEAELYPAISITGTVGFDAQRFTELFKDHSFEGSIGPGFQWNVFNYGRLINNVRLQDAKFCELVTHYRATVLQANSEAEDSIAEFLQSQLQAKDMQRSVDAAAKAVDLAITQYKGGLVDFNRVAVLEQNLVQQQDLLAQAEGDIDAGLVHLYRALGGGWEKRCEGVFDSAAGMEGAQESIPQGAEELPPGKNTPPSKPGPGTLSTPGQAAPTKPGLETVPNLMPQYQQQPGAPRRPLPGPAEMSPPSTSGTKISRPSARSVAAQTATPQSIVKKTAADKTQGNARIKQASTDSGPRENRLSQIPLHLRRSNDEASFDWTEDDVPLPPPIELFKQADPGRHRYPAETPAETDRNIDHGTDEAEASAPALLHAGLLPEDQGQAKLLR